MYINYVPPFLSRFEFGRFPRACVRVFYVRARLWFTALLRAVREAGMSAPGLRGKLACTALVCASCFLASLAPRRMGRVPSEEPAVGTGAPRGPPMKNFRSGGLGGCEYHPPVNKNSAVCRIARRIFGEIFGTLRIGNYICLAVNIIQIVLTPRCYTIYNVLC